MNSTRILQLNLSCFYSNSNLSNVNILFSPSQGMHELVKQIVNRFVIFFDSRIMGNITQKPLAAKKKNK